MSFRLARIFQRLGPLMDAPTQLTLTWIDILRNPDRPPSDWSSLNVSASFAFPP